MGEITERFEVRVEGERSAFVFVAEPGEGRLVIRQEEPGEGKELCALTLGDPEELADFFQGLRRVVRAARSGDPSSGAESRDGPWGGRGLGSGNESAGSPSPSGGEPREAVVEQARRRNAKAFQPWTPEEEQRVLDRHRAGDSPEAIARDHERSARAIEMRLKKLGALP